jgi:hypothetical protein
MRIKTGKEGIELIKNSERIYQDVFLQKLQNDKDNFKIKVAIRKYI